jgi:hypothetical protein
MTHKVRYRFNKRDVEKLPIHYHYFEKISSGDSKTLVKWHNSEALMTDKMFVRSFHKSISRIFK